MTKAYLDGKGDTIKMSKRQVVHYMKIEGEFLGFLAGLAAKALPFLARPFSQHWRLGHCQVSGLHLLRRLLTKPWEMDCI